MAHPFERDVKEFKDKVVGNKKESKPLMPKSKPKPKPAPKPNP